MSESIFCTRKPYQLRYSVDIDYLNQLSMQDVAQSLGIPLDRQNRCFCPDPNCSDHNSKHRSAGINPKNNTMHCFCCGNTWSNFTLAGMVQFGLDKSACYTAQSIDDIGFFLGKELGFGGITEHQTERTEDIPPMPVVRYHDGSQVVVAPLYKCFGLAKNPFRQISLLVNNGTSAQKEMVALTKQEASHLLLEKGFDAFGNTVRGLQLVQSLPEDGYQKTLLEDYQSILYTIQSYLPTLLPFLPKEEQFQTLTELYVHHEQPEIREYMEQTFPKTLEPLLQNLIGEQDEIPATIEESEMEYEYA